MQLSRLVHGAEKRGRNKKFQEIFAKEDGNVQLFVVGKQG